MRKEVDVRPLAIGIPGEIAVVMGLVALVHARPAGWLEKGAGLLPSRPLL